MATWETKTVKEIVQSIEDDQIVLPVIQRNLVWDEKKFDLLFDTLLKGNSFGGIMALEDEKGNQPLFAHRRFSRYGELHDSELKEQLDKTILLIIDGQQRLQAFFMGLKGSLNDKKLYFNLFSEQDYDFQFAYQETELKQDISSMGEDEKIKLWYPVKELYTRLFRVNDDLQVSQEIISFFQIEDEKQKILIQRNIARFQRAIFGQDTVGVSLVTVNKEKVEEERLRMVELFRRLNDGGTRLSAMDLAASALKGFDYRLESFLRTEITQFNDIGFHQDEVIKLLFLLRDDHLKEVTDIEKEDADFVVVNQERIIKTLHVLRQLLKDSNLYEYYKDGGKSVIPLYFVSYHIFHKVGNLNNVYANYDTNNPDFTNIKAWLQLSILNSVFSRGCGWIPYRTGVRKILGILKQYKNDLFPADELFKLYEGYPLIFNRNISDEYLARWDRGFVFYLIYGCKSMSGRDIDHIQPRSLLERKGVLPEKIHSIINFQLLDIGTNRADKRDKELKEWIKGKDKDYFNFHLIPNEPSQWNLSNYNNFLSARTELIIQKIKDNVTVLISPSIPNQPNGRGGVGGGGVSKEYDKSALWNKVPDVFKDHPVLKDETTLFSIFRYKTGCGPQFSGRYKKELDSAQLFTVSDFALLVITLGLEYSHSNQFGKFYVFNGGIPHLKTISFGSWAWGVVLGVLKSKGLDWEKFVIKD